MSDLFGNHIVGFPTRRPINVKGNRKYILQYKKHTITSLPEELEKAQNRAARFMTGNYVFETGSMTGILGQLKWESL